MFILIVSLDNKVVISNHNLPDHAIPWYDNIKQYVVRSTKISHISDIGQRLWIQVGYRKVRVFKYRTVAILVSINGIDNITQY